MLARPLNINIFELQLEVEKRKSLKSQLKLPGDEKLDEIFKTTIKPKDLQIGET